MIPVFVIARDRPSYLRRTVATLSRLRDVEIRIVDHGTTDPDARQWLMYDCPFIVHWNGDKLPRDLWAWDQLATLVGDRNYAVTDPDIDFTGVDPYLVEVCLDVLARHPHLVKVGPALRLDDLPPTDLARRVREWESQFWQRTLDYDTIFEAPIDTTFAVYRPLTEVSTFALGPAARLGVRALQVRHSPWYHVGPLTPELKWYRDNRRPDSSHWPPEEVT